LHRHEKFWDAPNAFDPDRFAPEKAKARHRCAYLPFGAGPRMRFRLMIIAEVSRHPWWAILFISMARQA
jgi:hypothetical protein